MCGNILSFQKPLTQDRIIQIILTSLNTLSMGLFYRWELTLPPNCLKFGIFAKELFQATLGARGFSWAVSGFGQVLKNDPRPTKLLVAREKKPLVPRVLPGSSCSKGGKRYLRGKSLVSG